MRANTGVVRTGVRGRIVGVLGVRIGIRARIVGVLGVRIGIRARIVGVLGLVRTPCTVYSVLSGPSALPSRAESLRLNRRRSAEQTAACIVSGGGRVLRLVRTPRSSSVLSLASPSRAESLRLNRLRASADMEGGRAFDGGCVLVLAALLVIAGLVIAAQPLHTSRLLCITSATTSQGTTTEFMTHTNASIMCISSDSGRTLDFSHMSMCQQAFIYI